MASETRIEGVDVARGFASLVMIQGHAYQGWASPEAQGTVAYGVTRVLGTFPLPAFLVLAGASLALRVGAAHRRGESAQAVRLAVSKRGLTILGAGYLTSAALAVMDGSEGLATWLRSDVLHVIGLSLMLFGGVGVTARDREPPDVGALGRRTLGLGLGLALLSPLVNRVTPHAPGALRYAVALLGDVPGVTRMPLFPLGAWMALGVGLGIGMLRLQRGDGLSGVARKAGATTRQAWLGLMATGLLAWGALLLTRQLAAGLDHPLSRADYAVWANLLDLGARGAVLLFLGLLCSPWLPQRARPIILLFGRYSLWAYVFHLPFCYGSLAFGARRTLSMTQASVALVALVLASLGVVWLRSKVDGWRRQRAGLRPSAGAAQASRPGSRLRR